MVPHCLRSLLVASILCGGICELNGDAHSSSSLESTPDFLGYFQGKPLARRARPQVQMAPDGSMRLQRSAEPGYSAPGPSSSSPDDLGAMTAKKVPSVRIVKDNNIDAGGPSQQDGRIALESNSAFALAATRSLFTFTGAAGVPKTGIYGVLIGFMGFTCILSFIAAIVGCQSSPAAQEDEGAIVHTASQLSRVEHELRMSPEGLDEDIYGMGIAVIIRDSQRFAMKTPLFALRMSRVSISVMSLIFTMMLQVFLMYEVKHLVTAVSTNEARGTYETYETWMYGNATATVDADAMKTIDGGYHRGVPAHFNKANFATLDDDVKSNACQMPLSQPTFFVGVLLIWTLLCAADIRSAIGLASGLVYKTPTIDSMADSCTETPEGGDEAVLVVGLTVTVKAMIAFLIVIPRICVDCVLLWLGCRWLAGTMGFSDLLQNTVTLGFILLLKDVFYTTMAPHHNKLETKNTLISPHRAAINPSPLVYLGAFGWGIMSIVWVMLYVEVFQQVLPEYNWDIHDACKEYLASVEALVK